MLYFKVRHNLLIEIISMNTGIVSTITVKASCNTSRLKPIKTGNYSEILLWVGIPNMIGNKWSTKCLSPLPVGLTNFQWNMPLIVILLMTLSHQMQCLFVVLNLHLCMRYVYKYISAYHIMTKFMLREYCISIQYTIEKESRSVLGSKLDPGMNWRWTLNKIWNN